MAQFTQRPDLNQVFTRGRLTGEPQTRDVNGRMVANFTLASNSRTKDGSGELITNFYRVSAWGPNAETCAKFLHKGNRIIVGGELTHRSYKDTNGVDRFSLDLQMDKFFFDSPASGQSDGNNTDSGDSAGTNQPTAMADDSDDLPF